MLACERKVKDRAPDVRAAGKQIPRGPGAGECLVQQQPGGEGGHSQTPVLVKQFRGMTRPEVGQPRVFHSFAHDPPSQRGQPHGVKTKSSLAAQDLINLPRKTKFEQILLDQQESQYRSKKAAPLGSSHDQSHGLPNSIDPAEVTFGAKTIKNESASTMVSPQKPAKEVDAEYEVGKELYRKSHNDWGVGEMVDRNYDWSKFTKKSLYGVPTPHDNSGIQVRDALQWLHQAQSMKKAPIVSKRVDNFRERTQPQLGKVHDPIAETLDVGEGHTFGVQLPADEHNAGELLHMQGPTTYEQCPSMDPGVLSSIRHSLKKNNFHNFDGLLEALQHHDTDGTGRLSNSTLYDVFFQFDIPLTSDVLEMLISWCSGEGGEGGRSVVYGEVVRLLNWKVQPDEEILTKMSQKNQRDGEGLDGAQSPEESKPSQVLMSNYRTSSQMIKAAVGGVPTENYRTYGVPTIRSDLPAPRIRRVGDTTSYGGESDAYGLMYPSIYSNNGVFEEDFFKPRTQEEVRGIFEGIGVSMTPEVFKQLWKEAARRDAKGEVSVESFRAIMEEVQAKQLEGQQ